jgi:hypothetical protein
MSKRVKLETWVEDTKKGPKSYAAIGHYRGREVARKTFFEYVQASLCALDWASSGFDIEDVEIL